MSLDIAAWNINERLGHPDQQDKVFEALRRVSERAGVIVLSEVCREKPANPDDVRGRLEVFAQEEGYKVSWTEYQDSLPRRNQPEGVRQYLAMLSRLPALGGEVVRFATRNSLMLSGEHDGIPVEIVGGHKDDRYESMRFAGGLRYVGLANRNALNIYAGDNNAMYGNYWRARLLRVAGRFAGLSGTIIEGPPDSDSGPLATYQRLDSRLMRASGMANGATLALFAEQGFKGTNVDNIPTHLIGAIDHILYRPPQNYPGDIHTAFYRGEKGPSDHHLIGATFSW